jgi:predicted MFS family arabinose efflux permease
MYAIYYLMFTTFPDLFTKSYHFSTGMSGLAYIGLGIGFMSSTMLGGRFVSRIYTTVSIS